MDLLRAMSMSVDLYDSDFETIHLDGAWARERHKKEKKACNRYPVYFQCKRCQQPDHNPFIALKRPYATEEQEMLMDSA